MGILSKIVKVAFTATGVVAGTKVGKEVGLNPTHSAIGGALLGYGSGSIIVDGVKTAVKGAKMAKAIAEELKAAKAAEALEATEAPTEETVEATETVEAVDINNITFGDVAANGAVAMAAAAAEAVDIEAEEIQ